MAQQEVTNIYITQQDFDEMKDINSIARIVVNYYNDPPAGYEILLVNGLNSKVLCARPCPTYHPPTQP